MGLDGRTVEDMRIVIAGGHGQIALRLERLLAARGDEVAGIIRRAEQGDDLRDVGAEPVLLDLESASLEEVAAHLRGADAAVFAAGARPGGGAGPPGTGGKGAGGGVAGGGGGGGGGGGWGGGCPGGGGPGAGG